MKEDEFMNNKEGAPTPYPGTVQPSLFESQLQPSEPVIIPPTKKDVKSKIGPKPETTKDNLQYK